MEWLKQILTHLSDYVRSLLQQAAHPESGLSRERRRFAVQLVVALALAGDVMLSAIVRKLPKTDVAMRHRYKAADRMLGEIDLVPVAALQTAELGRRVGPGHIIAVDLSDITKRYAKAMPNLYAVHDGSTGEIGQGYGLATAVAHDLSGETKAIPLPLHFEVFSAKEANFKSQPAVWMEMLRSLCAATQHGTFVMDREADNRRIMDLLLAEKRHFVIRVNTHEHSRHVDLFNRKTRARVQDAWKEATFHGELKASRLLGDGSRRPYEASYGALEVRLPGHSRPLWLCVFDSLEHAAPMVLLTTHKADTPEAVIGVLAMYFGRWVVEEVHRFAKQSFKLENIRALTWNRLQNLVAAVWIVLGAVATYAQRPGAETALRAFELLSQRLIKPLQKAQFWGYALMDGLRQALPEARRLLNLIPGFWQPPPPDPQLPLFGLRA